MCCVSTEEFISLPLNISVMTLLSVDKREGRLGDAQPPESARMKRRDVRHRAQEVGVHSAECPNTENRQRRQSDYGSKALDWSLISSGLYDFSCRC